MQELQMITEQPSTLIFVSLCLISSELHFLNVNLQILENRFIGMCILSSSPAEENIHLSHVLFVGRKWSEVRGSCCCVLHIDVLVSERLQDYFCIMFLKLTHF